MEKEKIIKDKFLKEIIEVAEELGKLNKRAEKVIKKAKELFY